MAEEAKNGNQDAVVASQGHGGGVVDVGTAVISPDAVENPGLPEHHTRITDKLSLIHI